MVDYPTQIQGDSEKMAAYRQAWNEVKADLRDELPATTHGVPDSKIKQEGVLQKALQIYRQSQSGGSGRTSEQAYNPGGKYGHIPLDIRMKYSKSKDSGPGGRSIVEYANDQLGAGTPFRYTETGKDYVRPGNDPPDPPDETPDPPDETPDPPEPDSTEATDSEEWDYPDAVDTPLEKKAWRRAGGDYAKAQRLIKQMKQDKRDPPEPDPPEPDPPEPDPPDPPEPDPPEPTDDSDGGNSSGTGLDGIDTRTAALGIGAAAAAAAAFRGGIR